MTDGVDPAMEPVQSSVGDPAADDVVADPDTVQLSDRSHPY